MIEAVVAIGVGRLRINLEERVASGIRDKERDYHIGQARLSAVLDAVVVLVAPDAVAQAEVARVELGRDETEIEDQIVIQVAAWAVGALPRTGGFSRGLLVHAQSDRHAGDAAR